MDITLARTFLEIVSSRSFAQAAQRLHVTQTAVSARVRTLEDLLGRQLFVRSNRGMVPTAHATQMYTLFLPVLADFERARAQLLDTSSELTGHARIGLPASIAQDILAHALAEFSALHPQVTVSVTEAYTDALVQGVASGQLDAAIVNRPRRLALDAQPVLDEDFVLATGSKHRLLPAKVPLRDAAKLRLVLPTRQHGLRAMLEGFADAAGVQLACTLEVDSMSAIVHTVEHGEFATILPRTALRSKLADGSLLGHQVVRPVLVRRLICVSHPRRPIPPPAAALLEVLVRSIRARDDSGPASSTAKRRSRR